MRLLLILGISVMLIAHPRPSFAKTTYYEVYRCNGGALQILFEQGQYGRNIAKITVNDLGIAQYVINGHFTIGRCIQPGSGTRGICRNEKGGVEISTTGGGEGGIYKFSWTKSHASKEIGHNRPAKLVAWRDLKAAPDGTGVRFQLMSDESVQVIDCGPTGEGPCREGVVTAPKITYRDWYFNDCKATRPPWEK
jgi:hypothetical protein